MGVSATAQEMIYDWHIVIVDATNNTIEAVVNRSSFTTTTAIPFEQEEVSLKNYTQNILIKNGNKRLYTFANMSVPTAFATVGATITTENANNMVYTVNGNGFDVVTNHIPMTSVTNVTVSNRQMQTIEIPVKRMIAKVEFSFSNLSTKKISVQKITMNNVSLNGANNIYLFPRTGTVQLPSTSTSGNREFVPASSIAVVKDATTKPTYTLYLNETAKPIYTNTIGFTITTLRDGKTEVDTHYTLTEVESLARNTFLKIPVALTDYEFKPRIDFYPPIGGYPEAQITSDANEVFYCTFKSGGQFILRPRLYNLATNELVRDANVSVVATQIEGTSTDMFVSELKYDSTDNGWYEATLSGEAGRVLYTLNYTVNDYGTPTVLQRKIYVIVIKP